MYDFIHENQNITPKISLAHPLVVKVYGKEFRVWLKNYGDEWLMV